MLTQSMRPKYKVDTYSLPMSDGVYLRGNNNHLILKGKSLYSLLERLVPHLNGNVTLEELTAGLDSDRKRMITTLIEKLFAHGFLKDTSQDQRHTLRPLEMETYATNIAFIEAFQTSAPQRFEDFRNKHLLMIGSGLSVTSLVQTGLQCGVKQISIIATLEDERSSHFFQEAPGQFLKYDDEQIVQFIDAPPWENEIEVRKTIQGHDAILHIACQPMLARAWMLNRLCVAEQKTLIQAMLIDDHAWIGPLVNPGSEGCWECAWRRLQANQIALSEDFSRDEWRDQPSVSHSRSLTREEATLIANQLLFALFLSFTQAGTTGTTGRLNVIDLGTFQSESHMFLPHPHCLTCQHPAVPTASQFLGQVQQLQQQAPLDEETFLKHIADCVDERCGLFTTLDSTPFVQVPLAVYKVNLANPLPGKDQPTSLDIIATGIDTREARMRVLLKACERYAANFLQQRCLLSPESVQQLSSPALSTNQLIGATPSTSEAEMWAWALDLQTQQVSLVPATHNTWLERGIASGKSWEEAICLALLDWCNYLTVEQLKDTQQPYRQVDLERMPWTPAGEHLYRLLKAAGEQIAVYDVTGSLRVPTFAVCLNERVVAYSTHCDAEQALRMGLEQVLRQYQSEHFQQADYALAPVPDCPAHLRSEQLYLPCYTLPDAWSARREWLLQQLQASGLRGFAIPLGADPALAQALPFIVRVLLSQKELEKGE